MIFCGDSGRNFPNEATLAYLIARITNEEEQGKRLIARLEDGEKQWKLSENDLKKRQFWPE